MMMEVPGTRSRGVPKRTCLDNTKNDLSERELSGEDAQDRAKMEASHKKHRPNIKVGKDAEVEDTGSLQCSKFVADLP